MATFSVGACCAAVSKFAKSGATEQLSMPMFLAALFTTAKMWKQPKCLSDD